MAYRIMACLMLSVLLLVWVQRHTGSAHAKFSQNTKTNGDGTLTMSAQQKPSPAIKFAPRKRIPIKNGNSAAQN